MLTDVGGIGYVSGALFGGVLASVAFVAIQNTFTKLGTDHVTLHGLVLFLAQLTLVLPATLGIGLGKNPSGVISDIVAGYDPVKRVKPVLLGGLAAEGLAYLLAWRNVISNWWFVVITLALFVLVPQVAQAITRERPAEEVPLELLGVDQPFTAADRDMLDRGLGLEGVGVDAPVR